MRRTIELPLSLKQLPPFAPQGANVNAAKLHETALHHAAKVENNGLIELLVEFGGNVNARDNLGKKPIHYTSPGSSTYLCLEFYESELIHRYTTSRQWKFVSWYHLEFLKSHLESVLSFSGTPLSLQQTSRVVLRRALGTRALEVISKLGLPSRIISFLSYMPHPVVELDD